MVEFHENRKSPEMVVGDWYMTHFDRRDLLKSKKLVWGRFRNMPDLPGPICDFLRFFRKFRLEWLVSGKNIFQIFDSEIFFQKLIFTKTFNFPETMIL